LISIGVAVVVVADVAVVDVVDVVDVPEHEEGLSGPFLIARQLRDEDIELRGGHLVQLPDLVVRGV